MLPSASKAFFDRRIHLPMAEASGEAFEQGEAVHVAMLRTGAISDFREKHMNVWDCPYTLTANRVEYVDAELEDGDRCFHAVRARFSNLTVAGTHPITLRPERVWGPKALFEGDDTIMCNRLFQPWRKAGRCLRTYLTTYLPTADPRGDP